MVLIKKLAFAPLFLLSFIALLYFFNPILKSVDFIFSLDLNTLYQLITLSLLILSFSLIFVLIGSFSSNLKIIIPIIILVSALPFALIETKLAIILAAIICISLLLTFVSLETKLKGYLTFSANNLLSPSIRQLSGLLIFGLCLIYYLSVNNVIQQKGFQIPDSLIDTALKFSPQVTSFPVQGFKYDKRLVAQLPQLTNEQLELLKKNPELLRQYGIDPKNLDNINLATQAQPKQPSSNVTPSTNMDNVLKQTVKDQIQNIIKPYQDFVPAVLAVLLFFTLQSFIAVLSVLLAPLLWLIFFILEKSNFIHYEIEMREVKKLVV